MLQGYNNTKPVEPAYLKATSCGSGSGVGKETKSNTSTTNKINTE